MLPETKERLEYLRGLTTKYGSQYLRQYFGFQLKDMAQIMGIKQNHLSMIIKDQRNLTDENETGFNQAFEQLHIRENSTNFKESNINAHCREIRQAMKY